MKYDTTAERPSFLLKPGEYPAQIIEAQEKTSKKGNLMLVVELRVYDGEKSSEMTDYIVLGGEFPQDWKLKNLAISVGLPVTGELHPHDIYNRDCRVEVRIEPAKNGYRESNKIADYLAVPREQKPQGETIGSDGLRRNAPAVGPGAVGDDGPPFYRSELERMP